MDENAERTIHSSPDTLLTMLEIANERSPRCSMYRKNMNHVDRDTTCWIMVHEHTGIMVFNSDQSYLPGLSSPYFSRSHLRRVYMTKNIRDTSSARLDPIAAPVMPMAGRPK